jgi:DNA polymerase I-like protein with 3'-5' exonuclease and polymerase domains
MTAKKKEAKSNLLASPKRPEFWSCFKTTEGRLLMHFDFTALEPYVLTHLSQDPNMLRIYGKDTKESHCIYMFVGYDSNPAIRAAYPRDQPGGPTAEQVDHAKKVVKAERTDVKPVYLGWAYGLGAETLSVQKNISYMEAKKQLESIDRTFLGKDILATALERERVARGGYVINGRGLPVPISFKMRRNLLNKVVQSTGHAFLQRANYHLDNYRKQHNIDCIPYIPDIHDESNWSVAEHEVERFTEAVNYAFDRLNDEVDWTVTFKHGGIGCGKDLSIRCD